MAISSSLPKENISLTDREVSIRQALSALSRLRASGPTAQDGVFNVDYYASTAIQGLQELQEERGFNPLLLEAVRNSDLVHWAAEKGYKYLELSNLDEWDVVRSDYKDSVKLYLSIATEKFDEASELIEKIGSQAKIDVLLFTIDLLCKQAIVLPLDGISSPAKQLAAAEAIVKLRALASRRTESAGRMLVNILSGLLNVQSSDGNSITASDSQQFFSASNKALNDIMSACLRLECQDSDQVTQLIGCLFKNGVNPADYIETALAMGSDEAVAKFLEQARFTNLRVDDMLFEAAHELLIKEAVCQGQVRRAIAALPDGYARISENYNAGNLSIDLLERCFSLSDEVILPVERYDILALLIQKGADLNKLSTLMKKKALLLALTMNKPNHLEVAKVLLDLGDSLSILRSTEDTRVPSPRHRSKDTVLHAAVKIHNADPEVVPLILAAAGEHVGDIINLRNSNGSTALHVAASEGNIDAVKALIEASASIDPINNNGYQPIHMAAESGKPGCA